MSKRLIPCGPTYDEMLHPETIAPELRQRALRALIENELDPVNLFNITWKDEHNQVRKIILPREITGVEANIVVLPGAYFPSGSHKVGPAYATLVEGCVDGEIIPGEHTILGPSTGNFGIGVAYIGRLTGCRAVIIMPDNMSRERYQRIRAYGGELELTPGTESDVNLTLQRTRQLMQDPRNKPLAQFELMPNYRFHRHVTGNSAVEAVNGVGNGRIACFVTAPGSAGTIAAGDQIKQLFPESKIVAVEPYECPTLATGARGHHRIEGIGDNMCTLIHNVLTTDYVALVSDEDCVRGLKLIRDGAGILEQAGVSPEVAASLRDLFGVSGVCNLLGAIKMAKYLRLGPGDNVVTIATDGFDRYNSVLDNLGRRTPEINRPVLEQWFREVFIDAGKNNVYNLSTGDSKERLFRQKERDWLPYGYTLEYLEAMKSMAFWDDEYAKCREYDEKIISMRQ